MDAPAALRRLASHLDRFSLPGGEGPRRVQPSLRTRDDDGGGGTNNTSDALEEERATRTGREEEGSVAATAKSPQQLAALLQLVEDASWCWAVTPIPRLPHASVTAFEFFRSFVFKNTPCVVDNVCVCSSWGAAWPWTELKAHFPEFVRVNATPNGRGDSVVASAWGGAPRKVFCKPEERIVSFEAFFDWLFHVKPTRGKDDDDDEDVLYLSHQNDSYREEFAQLMRSGFAPSSLPFGDAVFGKPCDAANLWFGDERATSVMHRDSSYENLYCVVRGEKVFHLLPPCAAPFLAETAYETCQYDKSAGEWTIIPDRNQAPPTTWIEMDVADEPRALEQNPMYAHVKHLLQVVRVRENQMLYLPAGWFHRVTQSKPTLAVNYWYDREFNAAWVLQEAVEKLSASS